jgi:hypothetical protein
MWHETAAFAATCCRPTCAGPCALCQLPAQVRFKLHVLYQHTNMPAGRYMWQPHVVITSPVLGPAPSASPSSSRSTKKAGLLLTAAWQVLMMPAHKRNAEGCSRMV